MLQFYDKMMNCSSYFLGPSIKSYNKDFIEIVWYRLDFSNAEMAQHFLKEALPFRANDPRLEGTEKGNKDDPLLKGHIPPIIKLWITAMQMQPWGREQGGLLYPL